MSILDHSKVTCFIQKRIVLFKDNLYYAKVFLYYSKVSCTIPKNFWVIHKYRVSFKSITYYSKSIKVLCNIQKYLILVLCFKVKYYAELNCTRVMCSLCIHFVFINFNKYTVCLCIYLFI